MIRWTLLATSTLALAACRGRGAPAPTVGPDADVATSGPAVGLDADLPAPGPGVVVDGCQVAARPAADLDLAAAAPVAPGPPAADELGLRVEEAMRGPSAELGIGRMAIAPRPASRDPLVYARPRSVSGPLATAAGVDPRALAIRLVRPARQCFEARLRERPGLAGVVTATLTIAASGRVSRVVVDGVDDAVSRCIGKAAEGVRFPPASGGASTLGVALVLRPPVAPAATAGLPRPAAAAVPDDKSLAGLWWADDGRSPELEAWVAGALAPGLAPAAGAGCAGPDLDAGGVARLSIADDGAIVDAQLVGLGSEPTEACLVDALRRLRVPAPTRGVVAACRVTIGDGGPPRATPGGGVPTVTVDHARVTFGGVVEAHADGALDGLRQALAVRPAGGPVLLRAAGDAPAAAVAAVVELLRGLRIDHRVAVEDAAGAPALALDGVGTALAPLAVTVGILEVELARDRLAVTLPGGGIAAVPPADAAAVAEAVRAATACVGCPRTARLHLDAGLEARGLLDAVQALRAAGVDRVVLAR